MNLLLFLLAGYDTTSNCLGYASYLLATHPDILAKAQSHVDEVFEANVCYC
jgi:cytochrome P450